MIIDLNNKRLLHIDLIKIVSIYMVLFNHTGENGFTLFTVARNSALYPFYMFNSILIKVAVPLFFMTSGALLLGKEESFGTLFRKRFLKYALVLLVGSIIEYLYSCLRINHKKGSFLSFLKILYTSNHAAAYWYLYAYLAFILMLPLLRRLAQAMQKRDYLWMAGMFLLLNIVNIIDFILWKGKAFHNASFSFFLTNSYVIYPLTGYFLENRLKREDYSRKCFLILTTASVFSIAICCVMTQYKCTLFDSWKEASCQDFFNTLIYVPAITVYYGIKMWFQNHKVNEIIGKMITNLGGATFGVFLIENICRYETKWIFTLLQPIICTLPACWIWIFAACCMGFILILALKKIPWMKNYI